MKKSQRGVKISDRVAKSLGEIFEKARQMDTLVAEIATASQEQMQGIGQLNIAVSQMDKVTQSNAATAGETATAAAELTALAGGMQKTTTKLYQLIGSGKSAVQCPSPVSNKQQTLPAAIGMVTDLVTR